jgi:hypothetical protein
MLRHRAPLLALTTTGFARIIGIFDNIEHSVITCQGFAGNHLTTGETFRVVNIWIINASGPVPQAALRSRGRAPSEDIMRALARNDAEWNTTEL